MVPVLETPAAETGLAATLLESHPSLLLSLGIALTALSHTRHENAALAWITNVPFLCYAATLQASAKSNGTSMPLFTTLVPSVCLAWCLAVYKIATPPLSYLMAPMFGLPIGVFQSCGLLFGCQLLLHGSSSEFDRNHPYPSDVVSPLAFAACMVTVEWAQHTFTPYASWGSMAYTQVSNLPFLQLASIAGLAGPSFLIYWFQGLLTQGLTTGKWSGSSFTAWIILMVCIHQWGSYRLTCPRAQETVVVAAVGTDSTFGGLPLPSTVEIEKINENLWKRTEQAATAGAKLVSWTEASTLIPPENEDEFLKQGSLIAKKHTIELIVAYIVPVTLIPLKYENKAVWIRPSGAIDHSYLKHEPVPGEPAIRGTEPVTVVETSFGRAAVAICYDYDFPYLSRKHALQKVQLVVVPSSDWLGIDPMHTQMASVRAIEGGFSLLRTTRKGLSAGIDECGCMRGVLSAHESNHRILLVTLPIKQLTTIYGQYGDILVYVSIAFVFIVECLNILSSR